MLKSEDLIGSAEAALILGVNRGYFNKLAARGEVDVAVKIPGRTGGRMFEREHIEGLAKTRANAA
jgi:hypothetical protein